MSTLQMFNTTVRVSGGNMICLTDIWVAASKARKDGMAPSLLGRNMDKLRPWYFLRKSSTKRFMNSLSKLSKTESLDIPQNLTFTAQGHNGGTYAHKLIAYKYAAFLDSDFEAGAYVILDKFFAGELQRKSDLITDLNLALLDFENKKDFASHCGGGLSAWKAEKRTLLARIGAISDQLQIVIPGLSND
ncbi:KilA-N domain-containing protein [Enterobacter asburiae]|nr:KilA-N domain-containing protein [Enterobacter asburiae]